MSFHSNLYIRHFYNRFYQYFIGDNVVYHQGRLILRRQLSLFSPFCIGLVSQPNGSALAVLKHHYITERIHKCLIRDS